MKRREFITLIGSAAASPLAARAQQPERGWRIGVLMPGATEDLESDRLAPWPRKGKASSGRHA
jgi:putative tryptophan/tyrosine transport system substrate-binding protein